MPLSSSAIAACLLPERRNLFGPATRRRIARLCLGYLGLLLLGLAIVQWAGEPHWQAFGLGLAFPGGGFPAHGDLQSPAQIAATATAIVLFVGALFLWFVTGNVIAPALVWLLAALAAAGMAHREVAPHALDVTALAVGAAMVVVLALALLKRSRAARRRRAANRYLEANAERVVAGYREAADRSQAEEFTLPELRLMRFLLDRALQPVASHEGFEWRDQFQTAAVRYQPNFMGYALAMAQATRLPGLGGYLNEAQRRLIDKQTEHRIWRYWALENLLGNFSTDPNPVARDNVTFTGLCATQIAMYHAASGCRDYDRSGSFALRHRSGKVYAYDLPSLIAALDREHRRSAFGFIAGEPNWIHPLANSIAAAAIKAHDQMGAGDLWSAHEARLRCHLEHEFITLAGRFVPCRSAWTGLAPPAIGGVQPQAMPCFFLNATMPDIALRQWLVLRRDLVAGEAADRALVRRRFWRTDTGNYRFSRASALAATALAAVELGDREVARLCLAALEEECPAAVESGALRRPNASVWAHAVEFLARGGRENGFRDLIEQPRSGALRPVISDVPYPTVLVARAVPAQGALSAVLYPGERPGRFRFRVCGLAPESTYLCDGTEEPRIRADREGSAVIRVALIGRTEIRIRPAA